MVEDDGNIRGLVAYALTGAGFAVSECEDAAAFWRAADGETPALVLLDIMLPGTDGLAVLARLKQNPKTAGVPVILLTAKNSEYDRVTGLDAGADDYVGKPFSVLELISRVKAVLRRGDGLTPRREPLALANVTLSREKHAVSVDGRPVALTHREFALLLTLMENPEIVFTRDRLLSAVWGTSYEGETRTVDMHVKTLRQKLGEGGKIIQTVRGIGYKAEA